MARRPLLPKLSLEVTIPLKADDLAVREHNRMVKDSLREVLIYHHRNRIPGHFERSAHSKYGYRDRSPKYIREKARRYHSVVDLVKTGKSLQRMLNEPRIVMGGAAEGGKKPIEGKLILKFDFAGGGGRRYRKPASAKAVLIDQMHKEVQAMTDDEKSEAANQLLKKYLDRLRLHRAGSKIVRSK